LRRGAGKGGRRTCVDGVRRRTCGDGVRRRTCGDGAGRDGAHARGPCALCFHARAFGHRRQPQPAQRRPHIPRCLTSLASLALTLASSGCRCWALTFPLRVNCTAPEPRASPGSVVGAPMAAALDRLPPPCARSRRRSGWSGPRRSLGAAPPRWVGVDCGGDGYGKGFRKAFRVTRLMEVYRSPIYYGYV
jgi:hypothetical protein